MHPKNGEPCGRSPFASRWRVFWGLFQIPAASLLLLLTLAGARAQEYYRKDNLELEVNHSAGDSAYLTITRRDGNSPPERLEIGVLITGTKEAAQSASTDEPLYKLSFRPGEAQVTATGSLDNGQPAEPLSGVYRLIPATERTESETARAAKLDAELNRVYGEVRAKLPAARQAELKDLQREWIHSVYAPEHTDAASEDPAGSRAQGQADKAAERIAFLRDYAAGRANSGPPALAAQLSAAEAAEAWPAVAEIVRHMLENSPKDATLWEKRARAFAKAADWPRCAAAVEDWAKAVPQKNPVMDALRGDAQLGLGNKEAALASWSACVQAAPKDAETRDKLASLLQELGNWSEAAKVLEQRAKIGPDAAALAHLAIVYAVLQDWKQAANQIHKASALDATNDTVHQALPRIERAEKALSEIKPLEKAIADAPKSVGPLLEHAALLFDLGWPEIALKDAEQALRLWPDSRGALVQKAAALVELGRGSEAEKLGITLAGDALKSSSMLRALAKADAALQANGPSAVELGRRAHHLNRAQQYPLATQDAEAALKLDPNCDVALSAKGETLVATGDDWAALPHARRAAELNPRNALAWYLAGEIDAKHHSFATAAEALTKVIALQPSDHDALELREKCYRELGRTADAEADAARRKTLEKK